MVQARSRSQAGTATASPWLSLFVNEEKAAKLNELANILSEAVQEAREADPSEFVDIVSQTFDEVKALKEECDKDSSEESVEDSEESSEEVWVEIYNTK